MKQRLKNLEGTERAALLEQVQAMEQQLSARFSDAQRFAVVVCLAMSDREFREADFATRKQLLRQRRQLATIPSLRADILALQWALQQFEDYESENQHCH